MQIIGVMGPGEQATVQDQQVAYDLGYQIAQAGWVVLTGGRNTGVMEAASRGAKAAGGLTIGILPTRDRRQMSTAVDLAIVTDLGNARNNINVLSSEVVIACGMGAGTAAEVALAIKAGKPMILLNTALEFQQFFLQLSNQTVFVAETVTDAIAIVRQQLNSD
ncbi:TIGR00725 family protein [Pantanalinema rosaneae CENA516]|uniref:TIGR00725 family protein n=1 Tax=Pantanalinema rosaneae TaxID=1620701 RepID=UPI003D6DD3A5